MLQLIRNDSFVPLPSPFHPQLGSLKSRALSSPPVPELWMLEDRFDDSDDDTRTPPSPLRVHRIVIGYRKYLNDILKLCIVSPYTGGYNDDSGILSVTFLRR